MTTDQVAKKTEPQPPVTPISPVVSMKSTIRTSPTIVGIGASAGALPLS